MHIVCDENTHDVYVYHQYMHIPCGKYVSSMRCTLHGALFITQNTCDEHTQDGFRV